MNVGRSERELQKTVEVDGISYNILMLPPDTAFVMAGNLGKMFAPSAGSMALAAAAKTEESEEAKSKAVAEVVPIAITTLMKNLDMKVLLEYAKELFKYVRQGNVELHGENFNSHFRGRLDHLYNLFVKCIEVQFQPFFGAVIGSISTLIAEATDSKSKSPSTSAGL